MRDGAYHRALCAAKLVLPVGHFAGMSVWRQRGLELVDLLVEQLRARLAEWSEPTVVEHGFLMDEGRYRVVFPSYGNVYAVARGRNRYVLRPDNMVASVDLLRECGGPGPLIAVGGLLREFAGATRPLFRERYIWPALQVTHLVAPADAREMVGRHQRVLEELFGALGLPVVSIEVDGFASYGSPCYLTVTVLPDGRPTVLSTTYVMSREHRCALGVDDDIIDVGLTGKVVALIAAHHRDRAGLALPSAVAPTQVGILADPAAAHVAETLRAAGLRAESVAAGPGRAGRARLERRWHRLGTPVVVGLDGAAAPRLATRFPLERADAVDALDADRLRRELAAHDDRLRARVERRLRAALDDHGLVQVDCGNAACRDGRLIFGRLTPPGIGTCRCCGRPGRLGMHGERFY